MVPFDLLECSFRQEQWAPRIFVDGDGPNIILATGFFPGYVTLSFLHIMPPNRTRYISNMIYFSTCPEKMSKEVWYPLELSSYTSWDGKAYAVPCTIPEAAVNANLSYDCPDGYFPPSDESDPRQCIQVVAALLFVFTWMPHSVHIFVPATCPRLAQLMPIRGRSTMPCGLLRGWYRPLDLFLMSTWLQPGLYCFQVLIASTGRSVVR